MPPLPVIADVYRCTFNWSPFHSVSPRNVLHVRTASPDSVAVGDVVVAALQVHMFEGMSGGHVLDSVTVLPLDGVSSAIAVPGEGYTSGSASDQQTAPQVAGVVSHYTGHRGSAGRGRTYIGPMNEGAIVNGSMVAGNAAEISAAWDEYSSMLNDAEPILEFVVASYVQAAAFPVARSVCHDILGTQRRRQDQLR